MTKEVNSFIEDFLLKKEERIRAHIMNALEEFRANTNSYRNFHKSFSHANMHIRILQEIDDYAGGHFLSGRLTKNEKEILVGDLTKEGDSRMSQWIKECKNVLEE